MAGLADFGYLYGAADRGSSAAFANRLPVDPNAPKVGNFPATFDLNLTGVKTTNDSIEALRNQAATFNKNNAILGEPLPNRDLPPVYIDGRVAPDINVTPAQVNQSNVQAPILGATQAGINVPPEPTVTIFRPNGEAVVVPVSQRAQVEAQIEAENRELINKEITSKDQAVVAAQIAAREKAKAGLTGPGGSAAYYDSYAPRSEADKSTEIGTEVYSFLTGQGGLFAGPAYTKAETEKVIYNGEEITKAAYDKLASLSPILAKAIKDNNPNIKILADMAIRAGVDPKTAVVTSVIESLLNPATGDSPVGAKGLMQVMPGTYEGTRLKFLKSSDPVLRELANLLPSFAVVGTKDANNKTTYSWNSKVDLTTEQQAAAGILYLRSLKDDYPERPDNIIFAMYHAGPGHKAFSEGKVPDTLGDRGVDKNGRAFGMYTSDYSTAAIGLYNQLALAGFGAKSVQEVDTQVGLKKPVDPTVGQTVDQTVATNGAVGVTTSANQSSANQNAVSLGNPTLPSTSFMIDIPPAQRAADIRLAQVTKDDAVAKLQTESDLRTRRAQEDDYRILAEYESKAAVILREIELAQIGRNPDVVTTKQAELAKLQATTQELRVTKARAFEDSVVATNQSNNAVIRVHDLAIQGLAIQEAVTSFSVNGNPGALNNLLREVAGSDTLLQPLASGDFAVLIRKPNSQEYVYQTDKSGNMTQLNKNAALDFARQIIDPRYAASVTAAVAEQNKDVSGKMLDAQIALQKVSEEKKAELFNNVTLKTYEAEFKRLEQTGQIKIDKTPDGKMIVIPEGQTGEFIYGFVINPDPPPVMVNGVAMPGSMEPQTVTFRKPGLTPKK